MAIMKKPWSDCQNTKCWLKTI